MLTSPWRVLSQEQFEGYWRDGFIVVEDLLSPELLAELRASVMRLELRAKAESADNGDFQIEKDAQRKSVRVIWNPVRYDDAWWRLYRLPALVGIARDLLGPLALLFGGAIFMKPPFEGSMKEWHQDLEQGFLEDDEKQRVLALGLAYRAEDVPLLIAHCNLDDSTTENGCLEFIPGSHTWGMIPKNRIEETVEANRSRIVPAPVRAGGAAIFHGMTFHYSAPNRSANPRRAPLVRFFSESPSCRMRDFRAGFEGFGQSLD